MSLFVPRTLCNGDMQYGCQASHSQSDGVQKLLSTSTPSFTAYATFLVHTGTILPRE